MHFFTPMNDVRRRALVLLAIVTALVFLVVGPALAHVELAASDPTEERLFQWDRTRAAQE